MFDMFNIIIIKNGMKYRSTKKISATAIYKPINWINTSDTCKL